MSIFGPNCTICNAKLKRTETYEYRAVAEVRWVDGGTSHWVLTSWSTFETVADNVIEDIQKTLQKMSGPAMIHLKTTQGRVYLDTSKMTALHVTKSQQIPPTWDRAEAAS